MSGGSKVRRPGARLRCNREPVGPSFDLVAGSGASGWGPCDGSQTLRWRRQSRANLSLKRAAGLARFQNRY
jgi:hypothetical protein